MDRTTDDERVYFRRRRAQHLVAARHSGDAASRERHERFADAYARRLATLVDRD